MDLAYDESKVTLETFVDGQYCIPGTTTCFDWTIPNPYGTLQSNVSFSSNPTSLPQWNGGGRFLLFDPNPDPQNPKPLSDATVTGGTLSQGGILSGDPVFITARFTLDQDIPASNPVLVTVDVSSLYISDFNANQLNFVIEFDVIQYFP